MEQLLTGQDDLTETTEEKKKQEEEAEVTGRTQVQHTGTQVKYTIKVIPMEVSKG